ncbi:hypothetical protein J437_LFUL003801 [Ladona fulva]|uniref:Uncharacterized protein n=1 Tax=Ladona fulva TaxID=123851 RepID=A0A8K0JXX6_LADFU|nr:hypothetical protein J437_LFUL003801 [Ladona fulva]
MNTYITELSAMVPMCHAMSRKLDKLTVLRMAVQHLKSIRGAAVHSYTQGHYKPSFLSDEELKRLILQAAEGFLFVVGCDRGRILYVSESVLQVLNYTQGDLLGQSWFDILHPKDVAKVKEQLSSSDLSPRERFIDAKTMLPVKADLAQGVVSRLCPGARRSFFCRMKCKAPQIKDEADTTTGTTASSGGPTGISSNGTSSCNRRKKSHGSDRKYSVIQCTGYLKSWAPAQMGNLGVGNGGNGGGGANGDGGEGEESGGGTVGDSGGGGGGGGNGGTGGGDPCNLSCLVAVGRMQTQAGVGYALDEEEEEGEGGREDEEEDGEVEEEEEGGEGEEEMSIEIGGEKVRRRRTLLRRRGKKCRRKNLNLRSIQFISRHAMDGKFLFVDQRATLVLGFLPQELLGTSMYEYYRHEDIPRLAEAHKSALTSACGVTTQVYRFRTKDGSYVPLQSEWRSFRNPWTKEVEYLVAKNTVIFRSEYRGVESSVNRSDNTTHGNLDFFSISNGNIGGREMQRLIRNHVEAGKIGRQIAEAVLDSQNQNQESLPGRKKRRRGKDLDEQSTGSGCPASPSGMGPGIPPCIPQSSVQSSCGSLDTSQQPINRSSHVNLSGNQQPLSPSSSSSVQFNPRPQISTSNQINSVERRAGGGTGQLSGSSDSNVPAHPFNNIHRHNSSLTLNSTAAHGVHPDDEMIEMMSGAPMLSESPQDTTASTDGNDEAAMAVIMSLLEADAGLGGPVDFSGLPWPLP